MNRCFAPCRLSETAAGSIRLWLCIAPDDPATPRLLYISSVRSSHPSEHAHRERSSAHKALAYSLVWKALPEGSVCISHGTDRPVTWNIHVFSACTTAPPRPVWDCACTCSSAVRFPLGYAVLDGCGDVWTGRPVIGWFRHSVPARSRCRNGIY